MTSHTIREIAAQVDVPPADALDLVRNAGVKEFWHEGVRYRADSVHRLHDELWNYLNKLDHRHDPTPDLEFNATPAQMAAILESELEQCISDLRVEASQNDVIPVDSPNLRRLLACGKLLQGAAA